MTNKQRILEILKVLKKLFPNSKTILNYVTPFELLVAVILSARNTDKKVNEITKKLFAKYKTIKDYARLPAPERSDGGQAKAILSELEKDLSQLGLFRQKAKFIRSSAKIIDEKYDGQIPKTMAELIELPGVGRKTANIILGNIYKIYEGIAVDTHVTRLSKLFGLTVNTNPEKIEQDLMRLLPKNEWFNFTNRIISYGRKYCPAHCKHIACPLRNHIVDLQ